MSESQQTPPPSIAPPGNKLSRVRAQLAGNFLSFASMGSSGGIVLMICTAVALAWANSPWSESYFTLWQTHLTISMGSFLLDYSLHHWINDGLMVLFFFLVGLEIKRELLVGELSTPRQALLPIIAALGGMIVPAGLYFLLNQSGPGARGWGIPMATDIAFALAAMSLLGKRVPLALKVFLAALAIADDLGAVLVIAIFYSGELNWNMLFFAALLLGLAFLFNYAGVRRGIFYAVIGVLLWYCVLKSGIHATIAGVLLAVAIPARSRINPSSFLERAQNAIQRLGRLLANREVNDDDRINDHLINDSLHELQKAGREAEPPLQTMEHQLQPWVAFLIMPIFALANAGVSLGSGFAEAFHSSVSLGIILGLVLGKQVGVTLFAWLSVKLGMAALPSSVSWRQIYGASWLCGIGFTMSLFVANLAFGEGQQLDFAKVGVLCASGIAGVAGYILLATIKPAPHGLDAPEAEG